MAYSIFKVYLTLDPEENHTSAVDLFTSLAGDLRETAVAWSGGNIVEEEWSSDAGDDNRLLRMTLHREAGNTVNIALGINEARVLLYLERNSYTIHPQAVSDDIPQLLPWLDQYYCYNADGLRVCSRAYSVAGDRNTRARFLDYIRSSDRHLPAVVMSPLDGGVYPLDQTQRMRLIRRLQGIATVFRLERGLREQDIVDYCNRERCREDQVILGCYSGAITVYYPGTSGYEPDLFTRYRQQTLDHDALQEAIFFGVARVSQRWAIGPESILQLERQKYSQRARAEAEQRAREQAEDRGQLQATYDEIIAESDRRIERLEAENNRLWEHIEEQDRELRRRQATIEQLQYHLNRRQLGGIAEEPEEPEACRVYLSDVAVRQYEAWDPQERRRWDEQVFPRLLDPQHRRNSSEAMGTGMFVYLRGRAANGRRVIYYLDGDRVMVCEVFAIHDEYERVRNQNPNPDNYGGFVPWNRERLGWVAEGNRG